MPDESHYSNVTPYLAWRISLDVGLRYKVNGRLRESKGFSVVCPQVRATINNWAVSCQMAHNIFSSAHHILGFWRQTVQCCIYTAITCVWWMDRCGLVATSHVGFQDTVKRASSKPFDLFWPLHLQGQIYLCPLSAIYILHSRTASLHMPEMPKCWKRFMLSSWTSAWNDLDAIIHSFPPALLWR